ncbi:MAG: N-acetylmuramoyl-L-alanine amidase, partial [Deltaproteobacteria bacterium]|nr:N-acetylmuramoyl-L-alanine amidase [Deltaproteobacteria bacterium]
VEVRTFMDPGGFTFYRRTSPSFEPIVFVSEDNETRPLAMPRRLPDGGRSQLGGHGWSLDDGSGDPTSNLRRVIQTVVLHHDGAHSSRGCYATLLNRGFSTHFMIDRDGTVYQAADVADRTLHAGGVNTDSVGIDLNNPADNLLTHPDAEAPGRERSAVRVINGVSYQSWNYTEEQYRSLIAVLRVLVEVLGIETVFPVGEDGRILYLVLDSPPASQFRGIQCHWHSSAEKWDPGPGLDWERIIAGLRRQEATIPAVPLGVAGVIKAGQGRKRFPTDAWSTEKDARRVISGAWETEDTASALCDFICRAIETRSGGGYYPIGLNQTWHDGIHIPVREGAPIHPILAGDVVAAHFVPAARFPELGSNNFVLMRHRIKLPPRFEKVGLEKIKARAKTEDGEGDARPPQNILTVFSLYMHLDGIDPNDPPDTGLFTALRAHAGGSGNAPVPEPTGPTLVTLLDEPDQMKALKAGYVGLFSPVGDEAAAVRLSPRDELWRAGEFGRADERSRLVHVEVFADPTFADAMELGLYGRYLRLGPDEPESRDLVVRSWPTLSPFGAQDGLKGPIRTEKVLTRDAIRDFFEYDGDDEQRDARRQLRKLITRHVSEWSDRVQWVQTLFQAQDAQGWRRRLRKSEAGGIFSREVMTWLPYIWLTEDVSKHIGAQFNDGVYSFFHPIYFLLWWMYRRSAVRGKSLEQIMSEVGGDPLSTTKDVPQALEDLIDMYGDGEWDVSE